MTVTKKKVLIITALTLLVALLTAATVTLAKYVVMLDSASGEVKTPIFFFRSNALGESASADTASVVEINGSTTEFLLTNGAGGDEYSNVEIDYTVSYSVYVGSAWKEVKKESYSFAKDTFDKRTITVTPLVYNGTTYDRVLVEAKSSSPYEKTLRAIFDFENIGYQSATSYSDGVITLKLITNLDSGNFTFTWTDGITPDNSDPNMILNGVSSSMRSLSASLEDKTVYELKFFVTDASLFAELEAGTKAPASIVTVSK